MAKRYKCKHPSCNVEQTILSKGLCNYHRYKQREANGELNKTKTPIKQISDKRKQARKKERGCLPSFFDYHLVNLHKSPFSEESNRRIYDPTIVNVCHLLPKRKQGGFPSVQCNLDNVVYLTFNEHTLFDKLLDERNYEELEKKFPNSWENVCMRLKKVLSLCTERNKMYFSLVEYLGIE